MSDVWTVTAVTVDQFRSIMNVTVSFLPIISTIASGGCSEGHGARKLTQCSNRTLTILGHHFAPNLTDVYAFIEGNVSVPLCSMITATHRNASCLLELPWEAEARPWALQIVVNGFLSTDNITISFLPVVLGLRNALCSPVYNISLVECRENSTVIVLGKHFAINVWWNEVNLTDGGDGIRCCGMGCVFFFELASQATPHLGLRVRSIFSYPCNARITKGKEGGYPCSDPK